MQGALSQLDTKNPVLYLNFPEGRMKFLGTLMFPANKYMVLKVGTRDILCEDLFDSMVRACDATWLLRIPVRPCAESATHTLTARHRGTCLCPKRQPWTEIAKVKAAGLHAAQVVFSEAFWIGTKEENPQEHKQPMPMAIIETGRRAQGMLSQGPSLTVSGQHSIHMYQTQFASVLDAEAADASVVVGTQMTANGAMDEGVSCLMRTACSPLVCKPPCLHMAGLKPCILTKHTPGYAPGNAGQCLHALRGCSLPSRHETQLKVDYFAIFMQARLLGSQRKRKAETKLEDSSSGDEDDGEENGGPALVLLLPLWRPTILHP